jgi:anti-anti-sigma factor
MAADTFKVAVADAGEDILITCDGELDIMTAEKFRASADWVVALHPEKVHLDCTLVTAVDSIGIKAMMQFASGCRGKGIDLTVSLNPSLQRLLDTIGVSGFFTPAP